MPRPTAKFRGCAFAHTLLWRSLMRSSKPQSVLLPLVKGIVRWEDLNPGLVNSERHTTRRPGQGQKWRTNDAGQGHEALQPGVRGMERQNDRSATTPSPGGMTPDDVTAHASANTTELAT